MPVGRENITPTLLEKLGFTEVSLMRGGVYHLKTQYADNTVATECIALLYSSSPITSETVSIKLFTQPLPNPMPPSLSFQKIQAHWQELDARRLEESGLHPETIGLPVDDHWGVTQPLEYSRPDDPRRIRHCIQLQTGDVICYN